MHTFGQCSFSMDAPLRIVIVIMLLINVHLSAHPSVDTGSCGGQGNVQFDTTCPRDCSQKNARIEGDTTFFDCTIGIQKDVDAFRLEHHRDLNITLFDPPTLESVGFYWKRFNNSILPEAALSINFKLPRGLLSPAWQLPEAVFVTFQSIQDSDHYYFNCPRERIFRFWYYHLKNSYELEHPRNISYDCFVGLDDLKDILVYKLTLQTFKGHSAKYTLTVPIRPNVMDVKFWRPVIATLYDTHQSIHAVIEQTPDWMQQMDFVVVLEKQGSGIIHTEKLHRSQRLVKFDGIHSGNYIVKVVYPNCAECSEMASHGIATKPSHNEKIPFIQDKMVILLITGSVCALVIVTGVVYFCVHRRREKKATSSLALNNNPEQKRFSNTTTVSEQYTEEDNPENILLINEVSRKLLCESEDREGKMLVPPNKKSNMIPVSSKSPRESEYLLGYMLTPQDMDNIWIPPSRGSLWDIESEECCDGRHAHVSCNIKGGQSLTNIPSYTDCESPNQFDNLQRVLATMQKLNMSDDSLSISSS